MFIVNYLCLCFKQTLLWDIAGSNLFEDNGEEIVSNNPCESKASIFLIFKQTATVQAPASEEAELRLFQATQTTMKQ